MDFLRAAAEDAYDRLIFPSLERGGPGSPHRQRQRGGHRSVCTEPQAPFDAASCQGQGHHGLDPGYRMGCKVAVVDGTGKYWIPPWCTPPTGERQKKRLSRCSPASLKSTAWSTSPLATAPASRETEQMAVELIHQVNETGSHVSYMIVSGSRGQRILCQPPGGGGVP